MDNNFSNKLPSLSYVSSGVGIKNNFRNANQQGYGREQGPHLPVSNIMRVMRKGLPSSSKVADSAKETVQECVSEFISLVTQEANERCKSEQRRTVTAEDILWSLAKLGFDQYVGPLSRYLTRYRHFESGRTSVRSQPLHVGPNFDFGPSNNLVDMGQVMVGDMSPVIGLPVNDEVGGDIRVYYGQKYDVGESSGLPPLPEIDPQLSDLNSYGDF